MINSWFRNLFRLREEELPKFKLLFFHSFFLWFFISFYFVPANGVFITHFGSDYLPLAYLASGIVGYGITSLYSVAQRKWQSKFLFLGMLGFMILLPAVVRLGMFFIAPETEKWLSFLIFSFTWPFISVTDTITGGLSLQFLNIRQVKQQYGAMNIGGIISSLLSYFLIPVIMPILFHPYDLLLIGISGLLVCVWIILQIHKKYAVGATHGPTLAQKKEKRMKLPDLFRDKYIRNILLFSVFSITIIYFTDFHYLTSIKVQEALITDASQASGFIALMAGLTKIGELVLSYFSNRIIGKRGVRTALITMPVLLLGLVFTAAVLANTLGTASIPFFIVVVISKASERISRRGLEEPAFNVLFQPLPGAQKMQVQTQVGVARQAAIGIAGGLLWVVSYVLSIGQGFQLRFYSLIFLPLLIAWILVSSGLYKSYKEKLRQVLADMSRTLRRDPNKYKFGDEILTRKLKQFNLQVVRLGTTILSETNPRAFERYASSLLSKEEPVIAKAVLKNVDSTYKPRIRQHIQKFLDNPSTPGYIKVTGQKALEQLDLEKLPERSPEQLWKFLEANNPRRRLQVIRHLMGQKDLDTVAFLDKLLEDPDRGVRRAAINLAGRYNDENLNQKMVRMISDPRHAHFVTNVLLESTKGIMPGLDKLFHEQEEIPVLRRIIELLAKIGTREAKNQLVQHIDYPNREIQFAVIRALSFCRYQATGAAQARIIKKIKNLTATNLWVLMAINILEKEKSNLKLAQALEHEWEMLYELLFHLLSFIYKPTTIALIKKNLSGENTIFALELIDNFLDKDIKEWVVPVVDDSSIGQRIRRLRHLVPLQKMTYNELLIDIIIKDYDQVSLWTRAKAIEAVGRVQRRKRTKQQRAIQKGGYNDIPLWTAEAVKETLARIRKSELPDEVFVCLHHTDEMVYSTAARTIYEENPSRCYDYLRRLSPKKQQLFDIFEKGKDGEKDLIQYRIKMLRRHRLFFSTPEYILVSLARIFQAASLKAGETFSMEQEKTGEVICIISKGEICFTDAGNRQNRFNMHQFIARGINIAQDAKLIRAEKDTVLLYANRYEYFNLLLDDQDIVRQMFSMLQGIEVDD